MEDKAQRHNSGKLKWSLVHFKSLHPLVEVLMFGAKKYAPDNWKKGFDKKELLDSMARHVTSLMDGEEFDSESKLHHIGHIMCNAMFYSFHFVKVIDDTISPSYIKKYPLAAEEMEILPYRVYYKDGGINAIQFGWDSQYIPVSSIKEEYINFITSSRLSNDMYCKEGCLDFGVTVYKLKD